MVISEPYKAFVHSDLQPRLFHYREARGAEIDLLINHGEELAAVEIKSRATVNADFFKNLRRFSELMKDAARQQFVRRHAVYGGDDSEERSDVQVLSWQHVR